MAVLSSATSYVDGDHCAPSHHNAKRDPIVAAVRDLDSALGDRGFSVTAGSVATDGSDSGAAINTVLSTHSNIYFPPGQYGTSQPLSIRSYHRIRGAGKDLSSLQALGSLCTIFDGSNLSTVAIEDMTLDLNGAARTSIMAGLVAVSIHTATDMTLANLEITGAMGPAGGGSSAAVGYSDVERATVHHVTFTSLGSYTRPNDGVYARGSKIDISHCIAEACTDTGFVLEACTDSSIADSIATGCAAGFAVSAFTSNNGIGVRLSNLILSGWSAPSTGGIQIAAIGACTLNGVELDGLSATQLSGGTGSCIFVRAPASGVLQDVSLRGLTANGTMAYIVQATDVTGLTVAGVQGSIVGLSTMRIGSGCSDVDVGGIRSRSSVTYGVYAEDAEDVLVHDNNITGLGGQMDYGVYFDSACTRVQAKWNEIRGAVQGRIGSASGVIPQVVEVYPNSGEGGIRFGKAAQAAVFVASNGTDLFSDSAFHTHLHHTEAFRPGIAMVAGNHTVSAATDYTVSVNSTSTTTVTLPDPSSAVSQVFNVNRYSTGTVIVEATSGASLGSVLTMALSTVGQTLRFQSFGTGYIVL